MGLKWFTTSWNHKYSPQMLWEHHFRHVKMDHSQLYIRGETITINKGINDMCWYQCVFDLEAFPPSRYFGVGCVCNVTRYVFPMCFLIFMGLKWFTTSLVWEWSPLWAKRLMARRFATIHQICYSFIGIIMHHYEPLQSVIYIKKTSPFYHHLMTTRLRLMSPLVVVDWCWLWLLGMRLATFIKVPRMQRV